MTKRTTSAVWDYFEIKDPVTPHKATCKICELPFSRGSAAKTRKDLTVSSLWDHLEAKHNQEFKAGKEKQKDTAEKRQRTEEQVKEKKKVYVISQAQPTLIQTIERSKKWNSDHPDQVKGNTLLAYWLCDAILPYSTTENKQFCKLIGHLQQRFNILSEKVLRQRVTPEVNRKVQYHVKQSLDENTIGVYAITTDIWSSKSKHSFISYTAHFITMDWK